MTAIPETRYANVGKDRVAYQVLGEGPRNLVFTMGQWGHVDLIWEEPAVARFLRRLASFSRLILFDHRGTGLSDPRPQDGREIWQHWNEELLAVMDAIQSKTIAVVGVTVDSGAVALRFAAEAPQRCAALILVNSSACLLASPDYPQGFSTEQMDKFLGFADKHWGTERYAAWASPSAAQNARALRWIAKIFRAYSSPTNALGKMKIQVSLDAREVLPRIRAPTLVMHRSNLQQIPILQGRYVAEHIPGARFIELPGADYPPFWETPDLILDHIEEFLTGVRRGGEPERALVAVLFTDIVDSTKRAAELGDAAWRALLDRHDEIQREQIGLFKGRLVDSAGDGTFATFERPDRAIECAQALQAALADIDLPIRAAIHFGDVELRDDGRVGGMTVHIGARVLAQAKPGEVLVSHTVQGILLGSRHHFNARGTHALKGVPGEWPLYALEG